MLGQAAAGTIIKMNCIALRERRDGKCLFTSAHRVRVADRAGWGTVGVACGVPRASDCVRGGRGSFAETLRQCTAGAGSSGRSSSGTRWKIAAIAAFAAPARNIREGGRNKEGKKGRREEGKTAERREERGEEKREEGRGKRGSGKRG